jgi:hypothetical protein
MQRKVIATYGRRGTTPFARMAIGTIIGLAVIAILANAKDMQKYSKLLGMSAGRPSGHP